MNGESTTPAMDPSQLIASLFALIPIPVAVADNNGGIVLSNSSFSDLFQGFTSIVNISREVDIPGHGTFEIHTMPLDDRGFKIIYATDVSVQAQMGKHLQALEKMASIGRVVSGIAQDLHNPLSEVLEYLPMMKQCMEEPALQSIMGAGLASAQRVESLVQNLLVIAGTAKPEHVAFDLNEIVRNVAGHRGARSSGPLLEITLKLEVNLPRTVGHPFQIEQVITSLLIQAEDAISGTPDSIDKLGSIQVQTGVRAGRVQVQVADNGKARDRARVFDPASLGMGLTACAEIARDHGGALYVWNAYGTGSTFTLELPAYGEEGAGIPASRNLQRLLQRKSVLVVDHESAMTALIGDVLSRHGADVQTSNSGPEAYEQLYRKEYDLFICNPKMPGLSGESLYRLMKSVYPSRNQQFLFVTSDAITAQDRQFFARPGVQYLHKPFRIQDLLDGVEGLLSQNPSPGF